MNCQLLLASRYMSYILAYSLERVYLATGCLPRICLRGKVFIEPLPSSGYIRHIYKNCVPFSWSYALAVSKTIKSGFNRRPPRLFFSMAQTGGRHLGPDRHCMVDDTVSPSQTSAGISLFVKVTFRPASKNMTNRCEVRIKAYFKRYLPNVLT
jgi:hypothetical protein